MPKAEDSDSLEDFAKANPRNRGNAWIETIPEWDTIREGWLSGIDLGTIRKWLLTKGYTDDQLTMGRMAHVHRKCPRGR